MHLRFTKKKHLLRFDDKKNAPQIERGNIRVSNDKNILSVLIIIPHLESSIIPQDFLK